ncbi:MAG: hypothetical protein IIY21_04200 [Clostridiales bacterium]|nr:hypothetical protein [Clostridiales bacterium]MBQ1573913.1 hypothetical protein [Clostridiales bacterium]
MSITANYETAKTLLPRTTPGIIWYTYEPWESSIPAKAEIGTYGDFLSKVRTRMNKGEFPKTFEYGWRDGNELKTVLYTDFLIDIESKKTGLRMGFDAIESYDIRTKTHKYVRPNMTNSRFWNEYIFVK